MVTVPDAVHISATGLEQGDAVLTCFVILSLLPQGLKGISSHRLHFWAVSSDSSGCFCVVCYSPHVHVMNQGTETKKLESKLSAKNKTWAPQEAPASAGNQKSSLIPKNKLTDLALNTVENIMGPAGLGHGTSPLSVQNPAFFHASLSRLTFCNLGQMPHGENGLCRPNFSISTTEILSSWQDLRFSLCISNIHDLHRFVSLPMEISNNLLWLHYTRREAINEETHLLNIFTNCHGCVREWGI